MNSCIYMLSFAIESYWALYFSVSSSLSFHLFLSLYIYIYIYIKHIHVCVCIYIYIYTHTHIYVNVLHGHGEVGSNEIKKVIEYIYLGWILNINLAENNIRVEGISHDKRCAQEKAGHVPTCQTLQ